jgi:Protein of unknown function (DUF1549)/Protein of unknown function (DUF1553)/Planctomycete cytochrome C
MNCCPPLHWLGCLAALALLATGSKSLCASEPAIARVEFFEKRIRPVLVQHCYACHSTQAKKVRGGLLLDSREGLRKGGEGGAVILPGNPSASRLLQALRYEDLQMPPKGKLADAVIADFTTWIQQGAVDPRERTTLTPPAHSNARRDFWAFRPPIRHDAPAVRHPDWPKTKIDRFLLSRLETAGLEPSPPADRRTWLRRLTFDLIGLPPSAAEAEAFVQDPRPDAEARVVDQLVASPQYGEHWARLWLDIARYAEDQAHIVGNDQSLCYPNAFLYRDWVIRAFNTDLPYDRFIELQLAADLLEPGKTANLPALGFLGLGPKYYSRRSLAVMADEWEDRVDVVSRGLLGLTVACARCHDHKYDPISTQDYYALAGVFASTRMYNRPVHEQRAVKSTGEAKDPRDALHIVCEGKPTDLPAFVRGDVNNKGPIVPRHFVRVLCTDAPPAFHEGSGRLELARAIVARDNPLTARVIVNRLWGQLFRRPLVATASNFGKLGEPPTHPELLDDLAVRFMDNGWSLKWLVRELVLSAAYRQSTGECPSSRRVATPRLTSLPRDAADPDNRLLGRMSRRRLTVEEWRDAVLAVTGRLDHAVGGRSINPADSDECRRTVYSRISRLSLNPLLALFDFPDPNLHADHRGETTTPLQKLFELNNPFLLRQARALVERLGATSSDDNSFLEKAYLELYGRPPTAAERQLGLSFLGHNGPAPDPLGRREEYAHILLATDELWFID